MFSSSAICTDGSQFGSAGAKTVASEFSASLLLIFLNADYPFFFSTHLALDTAFATGYSCRQG